MLFKSLVSKLKIASATVIGGIKVGDNLTIEPDGKLNATGTACQMFTFKASDGGFDWFCLPIFGTWVAG